ncbi:hypothetical protein PILCRDRAFT_688867 [Piloderma croceum F 1598]|uniref:Uncharacterized protein n=1 Tax=Piloderma croceum (strain F 1598) TaxID=765440 RepID=A0A0C3F513_PILCF|nr:hypothetical protein PILCRDRAFT_688867 [Piloderma croceum F 1598]
MTSFTRLEMIGTGTVGFVWILRQEPGRKQIPTIASSDVGPHMSPHQMSLANAALEVDSELKVRFKSVFGNLVSLAPTTPKAPSTRYLLVSQNH